MYFIAVKFGWTEKSKNWISNHTEGCQERYCITTYVVIFEWLIKELKIFGQHNTKSKKESENWTERNSSLNFFKFSLEWWYFLQEVRCNILKLISIWLTNYLHKLSCTILSQLPVTQLFVVHFVNCFLIITKPNTLLSVQWVLMFQLGIKIFDNYQHCNNFRRCFP